jgi:LPS-assembly lipoprotein
VDARPKAGHDERKWGLPSIPSFIRMAALSLALALTACGFHPLYGDYKSSVPAADFASVYIAPISDRSGPQHRNFLIQRLNFSGQPARPLYTLTISLAVQGSGLALARDNTTTRASLTGTARYTITDTATGKVIERGTSRATDSYDVLVSDYATLSARDDAQTRVLRELSDDIQTRLAVFLNSKRSPAAG